MTLQEINNVTKKNRNFNAWKRAMKRRVLFYLKTNNLVDSFIGVKEKELFAIFSRNTKIGSDNVVTLVKCYLRGELNSFKVPKKTKKKVKYKSYNAYLKSAAWKRKREEAFTRYGRKCAKCGSEDDLRIHHKTYENIFNEKMEDLMVVCETCHVIIHQSVRE